MSRSSTITEDNEVTPLEPITPGEILLEEFIKPHGLSQNALARGIGVPVSRISAIVHGERAISADTALRLARFLGTTPGMWLALQAEYDLRKATREHGAAIEAEIKPWAA
jgi:addiction module HigA family antidote